MAVTQVVWPDDVPFQGTQIPNFQAGQTSGEITVRLYVDRDEPLTGTVLPNGKVAIGADDPSNPGSIVANNVAPLDELWTEVRFTADSSATIAPFETEWTKLGTSAVLAFPEMVADSYRTFQIRWKPPSYATSFPYIIYTLIHSNSRATGIVGPTVDLSRGIVDGYRDDRITRLIVGGEVLAAAIPDDTITVTRGHMQHEGDYVGYPQQVYTIDDTDFNDDALLVGESYWLMVTKDATGNDVLTKGVKDVAPDKPSLPVQGVGQEVWLAYVNVDYTGGAPVINPSDIELSRIRGHHELRTVPGDLTGYVSGGEIISAGTFKQAIEESPVAFPPNTTSYVWNRADGYYTVEATAAKPDAVSDLLYEVTTDGLEVTSVVDRREFYTPCSSLELYGDIPNSPGVIDEILYSYGCMIVLKVIVEMSNGTGNVQDTIFDIEVDGTSIYPNPLIDDTRPRIAFGSTEGIDSDNLHAIGVIPEGSRVTFRTVQQANGIPPSFAKARIYFR